MTGQAYTRRSPPKPSTCGFRASFRAGRHTRTGRVARAPPQGRSSCAQTLLYLPCGSLYLAVCLIPLPHFYNQLENISFT